MTRLQADGWLVLTTFIWGTTFVAAKNLLGQIEPMAFVAGRFWVAGVALLLMTLILRRRWSRHLWRDGLVAGLFLAGGYITQTIGLDLTSAGKTAFITGLSTVIVPILSGFVLRHFPVRPVWVGVVLATVGLALMTLDDSLTFQIGDGWTLACAFLFALHLIVVARVATHHDAIAFTMTQVFWAAAFGTVASLLFETPAALQQLPAVWPAILFFGIVATALTFGLYTAVQPYTTATHTALIVALEPVFAALFGLLIANEILAGREWLGGALMLGGVLIAELGSNRKETAIFSVQES